VKILEALATWPEGARLRALTDRRPMHLYAQLEERGFVAESQEQKDGSFVTHVRRR
jgi:tRNA 2-thiouridine synthesizing protein A